MKHISVHQGTLHCMFKADLLWQKQGLQSVVKVPVCFIYQVLHADSQPRTEPETVTVEVYAF